VKLAITGVAMLFICAMLFATVFVLLDKGPDVLTLIGLLVVGVLSFGILGALTEPDKRRRR
jgi:hypothetical protein